MEFHEIKASVKATEVEEEEEEGMGWNWTKGLGIDGEIHSGRKKINGQSWKMSIYISSVLEQTQNKYWD